MGTSHWGKNSTKKSYINFYGGLCYVITYLDCVNFMRAYWARHLLNIGELMTMLGRLFGTDKAISDITDKDNGLLTQVGGWVGNFNYTAEEQAENNHKTREWGLKQLEALAPFKVVQRILAFATCLVWILVIINVLVSIWIEAIHPEILIRKTMLEFAFSDFVFWPVTVCFALYFGGGLVESIKRRVSSID